MPFLTPAQQAIFGYLVLFLLVAPLFPFIYVVARWRSASLEPGFGTYAALLYFLCASLLLFLAGTANLFYGWMSTTPIDPALDRLSWGMFTGSLGFLALNVALARIVRRRRDVWGDARRVFAGFFMVMTGLVSATALVLLFVQLFRDVETMPAYERRLDDVKLYGAWTIFFLAAYLATVARMAKRS